LAKGFPGHVDQGRGPDSNLLSVSVWNPPKIKNAQNRLPPGLDSVGLFYQVRRKNPCRNPIQSINQEMLNMKKAIGFQQSAFSQDTY
jgi:hypothetical protein